MSRARGSSSGAPPAVARETDHPRGAAARRGRAPSAALGRLLAALPAPTLRRLARAYRVEGSGAEPAERRSGGRAALTGALLATPQVDAEEVVTSLLRPDELRTLARALDLPAQGTSKQLARRLAARLRWRPFDEARDFARGLGLPDVRAWRRWVREGCPDDVPRAPDVAYRDRGWRGFGDWLGTERLGKRGRTFRTFVAARALARSLGLRSSGEWEAWCQGERPDLPRRPADVPTIPGRTYPAEWRGWGDFLGTDRVPTQARRYLPFAAARARVRGLGLRNQEEYFAWWRRSGGERLPLPCRPRRTYGRAWRGWGDFLGTGHVANQRRTFRPFAAARAFVRGLGLASLAEWVAWCAGRLPGKRTRPADVPTNPRVVYAGRGWVSLGDWLGTGVVATSRRKFRGFAAARRVARSLGLATSAEWRAWCQGRLPDRPPRPADVPTNPWRSYAGEWAGWRDWLGRPARRWRPFAEARAFARGLGLPTGPAWKAYVAGERPDLPARPADVPACPDSVYARAGWVGWPDWLGPRRRWRPYTEARAFARGLGLRTWAEWVAYAAGRRPDLPARPEDVPATPNEVYAGRGWRGARDWLGPGSRG